MVDATFEIFLLYHIRKYIGKNLVGPLHEYSGAIEKYQLIIIMGFY